MPPQSRDGYDFTPPMWEKVSRPACPYARRNLLRHQGDAKQRLLPAYANTQQLPQGTALPRRRRAHRCLISCGLMAGDARRADFAHDAMPHEAPGDAGRPMFRAFSRRAGKRHDFHDLRSRHAPESLFPAWAGRYFQRPITP